MGEAIFGLIGVIVGAVVTGAVEWWHARQARRMARRVAARLVMDELENVGASLLAVRRRKRKSDIADSMRDLIDRGMISDSAWKAHRGTLAETLHILQWKALSDAFTAVSLVIASRQHADTELAGFATEDETFGWVREAGDTLMEVLKIDRRLWRMGITSGGTSAKPGH